MSTHTTYFCDHCNSHREISDGDDDGHAVNYTEAPTYDGWAEFQKPYTDRWGDQRHAERHVCARCLADPEFDQALYGEIAEWDTQSRESLEKGRRHAEAFASARELLSTRDRWGAWRGVEQVFGDFPYGYQPGPRLEDGRFRLSDEVRTPMAAAA